MARSNHSTPSIQNNRLLALPTTSLAQQVQRQRLSDDWQPQGFDRYAATQFLVTQMPVIGGNGSADYPPDRFSPVPLQEGPELGRTL